MTSLLYFADLLSAVKASKDYDTMTIDPTSVPDAPPTKANEKEFDKKLLVNKTKPTPCDMQRWLYELHHYIGPEKNPFNRR